MAVSDLILSVLPEKYRRDVVVLTIGASAAAGWLHFEGRIDVAYAAAATTQALQTQIVQMQDRQKLLEAQSATTQSNGVATKQEVDMLVQVLLKQEPLPTAPPVTATSTTMHSHGR